MRQRKAIQMKIPEPKDGFYVLLYLHDWDPDGKIYPQAHGLYLTWQEAEKARNTKISPEKYWAVRVRFITGDLAKKENIPDQNIMREDIKCV